MRKMLSQTRDHSIVWSVFLLAFLVLILCTPHEIVRGLSKLLQRLSRQLDSLLDQAYAAGYAAQARLKVRK